MTTTQTETTRTHDRLVTQLQSALQAVREQVETDPPKMGRSTKRRFRYQEHGFDVVVHVTLQVDWRNGCRAGEAIDRALNMAIGAADRLDDRNEFDYSPRQEGQVTVRIMAQTARE